MKMNIYTDVIAFLASVLSGGLCGILFDILRVFTSNQKKQTLVHIFDFIFVLLTSFSIFSVFWVYTSFKLRLYMFFGIFLGLVLYFLLFSTLFTIILKKILKLFGFIFKILLTPTQFLYKILVVYPFGFVTKIVSHFILKIKNLKLIKRLVTYEKKNKQKKHKAKLKACNNRGRSVSCRNVG